MFKSEQTVELPSMILAITKGRPLGFSFFWSVLITRCSRAFKSSAEISN